MLPHCPFLSYGKLQYAMHTANETLRWSLDLCYFKVEQLYYYYLYLQAFSNKLLDIGILWLRNSETFRETSVLVISLQAVELNFAFVYRRYREVSQGLL